MRSRFKWSLFIIMGFIILIADTPVNWKYFFNVMKELRELLRRNSKYSEDGDFVLVHRRRKCKR